MTTTKAIVALIIVAAASLAGGLLVGLRRGEPAQPADHQTLPGVTSQEPSTTGLTGTLVVVLSGGKIENINLADSTRSQITTDEKLRIAKVAPTAGQLVTLTSQNATTGNLNLLDVASGKVTKLAELSLAGLPPVVTADGKRYLSASFSNFEVEFGWHVYLNTVGSSEKKEVFTTPESLTNVSFSPDGGTIAFVVSKGKGGSEVTVVKLAGGSAEVIYKTEGEILSLGWGGSSFTFTEAPAKKGKANEAELYQISETGKDKRKLTANQTAENFVAASANGKLVAYLDVSYSSGNVTPDTTGEVTVLDINSQKSSQFGQAVQVAGFLK